MNEFQRKLDAINQELYNLTEKKANLCKEIEQSGYYVDEYSRIQKAKESKKDEEVMGLFWDFSYASFYVSEKGMLFDQGSGAITITDEQIEQIRTYITDKNYDDLGELLDELTETDTCIWENTVEYGNFKVTDESISWKTKQKGHTDQMEEGSEFSIRKSRTFEIECNPIVFEENISRF